MFFLKKDTKKKHVRTIFSVCHTILENAPCLAIRLCVSSLRNQSTRDIAIMIIVIYTDLIEEKGGRMKFLHCYQLKPAQLRLGGECKKET